jgi:hypothetical protein
VFIDADHVYAKVKEDLNLWYHKIKKGGIVSGDDYTTEFKNDVIKAVDEFVSEHNLRLNTEGTDNRIWWFQK